jgi:hypothetical protein
MRLEAAKTRLAAAVGVALVEIALREQPLDMKHRSVCSLSTWLADQLGQSILKRLAALFKNSWGRKP